MSDQEKMNHAMDLMGELRTVLSEMRIKKIIPKWIVLENGEVVSFECGKVVPLAPAA